MNPAVEVTCIGEAIVDLVSLQSVPTLMEASTFKKALGGEAANVAVGLAKLGTQTAFFGKVGNDPLGKFLVAELSSFGVDASGVRFSKTNRTRLAFVTLTESGDREFEFWEKRPAGSLLRPSDINMQRVIASKIVVLGSLLLLHPRARSTIMSVAQEARSRHREVAFDANVRLSLWRSPRNAREYFLQMIRLVSILCLNGEEAKFLAETSEIESAAARFLTLGPRVVFVTLGERGSYFQTRRYKGYVEGFKIYPVDTTGCGDGYFAGILHSLVRCGSPAETLSSEDLQSICRYANAVGALTALKRGAAAAMPSGAAVDRFLKKHEGRPC